MRKGSMTQIRNKQLWKKRKSRRKQKQEMEERLTTLRPVGGEATKKVMSYGVWDGAGLAEAALQEGQAEASATTPQARRERGWTGCRGRCWRRRGCP